MPKFSYRAIDQSGRRISGMLDADSLEGASNLLNHQGYIPIAVRPAAA